MTGPSWWPALRRLIYWLISPQLSIAALPKVLESGSFARTLHPSSRSMDGTTPANSTGELASFCARIPQPATRLADWHNFGKAASPTGCTNTAEAQIHALNTWLGMGWSFRRIIRSGIRTARPMAGVARVELSAFGVRRTRSVLEEPRKRNCLRIGTRSIRRPANPLASIRAGRISQGRRLQMRCSRWQASWNACLHPSQRT